MNLLAYKLDFSPIFEAFPRFMYGAGITLLFGVCTVFFGTIFGFIVNLGNISKYKWVRAITRVYISILRGTPAMIQLYICFYGIPLLMGMTVNAYAAGIVALSLNSSAYVAEIFRSGFESVDHGQTEASRALGFSRQYTIWKIVFPQALKNVLPAIGNEFVSLIKESSIVSLIGIMDITHVSDLVKASTYQVFESLLMAAAIYYVITTILTLCIRYLEKRLNKYAKR